MARITMRNSQKATFAEVFEVYISAVTARGVKDKTIATYKQHFHAISKRLDVSMPISPRTINQEQATNHQEANKKGVRFKRESYSFLTSFDANAGEEIGDVMDAIAFISQYADVLEIDTQRIVMAGHSAGGHIISMIAYAPPELFPTTYRTPDVKCVGCVALATPFMLYPAEFFNGENMQDCIRMFPNDTYDEEVAQCWSPYNYISKQSPATLIVHGDSDPLVPIEQILLSMEKAREVGADFAMICPENGGHRLQPIDEKKAVVPSYEAVQQRIAQWVCGRFTSLCGGF